MRPNAINPNQLLLVALLSTGLSACGLNEQDPSFLEERSTVSIALTVDDNGNPVDSESAVSSEDTSQHLDTLDEAEVLDILDAMESGDDEWTESDADAVASGSGSTSDGSATDGNTSDDNSATIGSGSDGTDISSGDDNLASDTDSTTGDSSGNGNTTTDDTASNGTTTDNTGSDDTATGDSGTGGTGTGGTGTDDTATDDTASGDSGAGSDDSDNDWGSDLVQPSNAELKACAQLNGVSVKQVKVAGNKNNASIQTNTVVAIKLAGNQSTLDLQLSGTGSIAGLCLFVTGNQGLAKVKTSVALGNFIYIGRGNRSSGDMNVLEGSSVSNIVADLRGNQAKLSIHGSGTISCNTARVNDKTGGFQCN